MKTLSESCRWCLPGPRLRAYRCRVDRSREPTIRLCGGFDVTLGGDRVTPRLPGRQGRLVLAYLACNRRRTVTRDELIDLLWPIGPPARPDEVLGALLSKLRRALGPGVLDGRQELTFRLPTDASIDLELATTAVERAETALADGEARSAWEDAQAALSVIEGGFLPGFDGGWVQERRREVEEFRLRALGCVARAGLSLGGAELAAGERAARELISAAPLSEPGYGLLMEILASRGDVATALQCSTVFVLRCGSNSGSLRASASAVCMNACWVAAIQTSRQQGTRQSRRPRLRTGRSENS